MADPIGVCVAQSEPPLPCMIYSPAGVGPSWELCAHEGYPRRAECSYTGARLAAAPGGILEVNAAAPYDQGVEAPFEVVLWLFGMGPLVPVPHG